MSLLMLALRLFVITVFIEKGMLQILTSICVFRLLLEEDNGDIPQPLLDVLLGVRNPSICTPLPPPNPPTVDGIPPEDVKLREAALLFAELEVGCCNE